MDVNTLLNFNFKHDWILAVQFGHTRSINTQPRVISRREEEEEEESISINDEHKHHRTRSLQTVKEPETT
jgi:hypothetical protein